MAFLDADDLWAPEKLDAQVSALRAHSGAGAAYCWSCFVDEAGNVEQPQEPVYHTGDVYEALLVRDFIWSGSNVLARADAVAAVGSFDVALGAAEDWDYWVRLAARFPFALVPKHHVFYRRAGRSTMGNLERDERAAIETARKAFAAAPKRLHRLLPRRIAEIELWIARAHLRSGRGRAGVRAASRALRAALVARPAVALDRKTLRLLSWWLLAWIFPASFVERFGSKFLPGRPACPAAVSRAPEPQPMMVASANREE